MEIASQIPFKKSCVASKDFPPALQIDLTNYKFGRNQIAQYRKVCNFATNDESKPLPVLCTAMPVISLAATSLAAPGFPMLALGCIHTRQTIVCLRRVTADEKLNFQCTFGKIEDTDKGTEVTINQIVSLSAHPEVIVLKGEMTFLSRAKSTGKKKTEKKKVIPAEAPCAQGVTVKLPANSGRSYAAVSGDFNPIHLYKATSMLFGFKKPILHGFATLSRVLAE